MPTYYSATAQGDLNDLYLHNYEEYLISDTFTSSIGRRLWLWGSGTSGRLGDETVAKKSSPVQTVAGGTNWKEVSCADYHTAAIKTDGTLWTWGRNDEGELGNNSTAYKSSPVQTVAGGTTWKQLDCGSYHVGAIKTDGTLWMWGGNWEGQLGDNSQIDKSSPVQTVVGGTNWKQVSCGYEFSAAVKTDGTLWCWGYGDSGQLGNNFISKLSPVQTVAGGTNWKQVSCGDSHTAAIKTDGTLWTWGANNNGQLGDNTRTNRISPIQTISGGTNWKFVSCGSGYCFQTAGIKTDGTLWLWGENNDGELGDNSTADKSSPVQTVAGGNNWSFVALSIFGTAAVTY